MKVNISDIIRVNGASIELNFEEEPIESEPVEGCLIDGKLSFSGTLTNNNGILQLDGCLKAAYSSECYRCLSKVSKVLELNINENFVSSTDAEQTDMYPFEGKVLDISKVLNDNIILSFPMKQLCSNDCKGLCKKCGANLNEVQCGCGKEEINPCMEDLNKYFDNL